MFCRFGSLELSRPVAVTVWLNDVWIRPVAGLDERGQRVDIGALELGVLAVLEQLRRQRMERGEFLEHLRIGARAGLRPLHDRQPELVEEHGPHLERRGDREGVAGEGVDLPLEGRKPRRVVGRERGEHAAVDPHAAEFHVGEHRASGSLHVAKSAVEARGARAAPASTAAEPLHEPARAAASRAASPGRSSAAAASAASRRLDAVAARHLREAEIALARVEQVGGQQRVERPRRPGRMPSVRSATSCRLRSWPMLGDGRIGEQPATAVAATRRDRRRHHAAHVARGERDARAAGARIVPARAAATQMPPARRPEPRHQGRGGGGGPRLVDGAGRHVMRDALRR